MDEVFIFLGSQQDAYFFMHTVVNEDAYKVDTGAQIYNCMIAEHMFYKPGNVVIIFDMHIGGHVNVIVVQHTESEVMYKYDKHNLVTQFKRLMRADRGGHKILTFAYKSDIGAFVTNELSANQLPNLQNGITNIERITIAIRNIEYMMSKKSFAS